MKGFFIKSLVINILFCFLLCFPFITPAQEKIALDQKKLKSAEMTAYLFIERFRQTLDLTIFWKDFRSQKLDCTLVKFDGVTSVSDEEKVKIGKVRLEKASLALMNYYYLSNAYLLTIAPPDSKKMEENIKPKEILNLEKTSEYIKTNGKEPKTAKEVDELTFQLNKVSKLYRKYMPQDIMKSSAWKANYKQLLNFQNYGSSVRTEGNGDSDFCIPKNSKYYTVDRGLFYFYIVEEKGKMKVVGLGIGN